MQQIGRFLVDYWQLIVAVILFVFTWIYKVVKKDKIQVENKVVNEDDYIKNYILSMIPEWINYIEQSGITGATNKQTCFISKASADISKNLGLPVVKIEPYLDLLESQLEKVLSTPTKKGGSGREKENA